MTKASPGNLPASIKARLLNRSRVACCIHYRRGGSSYHDFSSDARYHDWLVPADSRSIPVDHPEAC